MENEKPLKQAGPLAALSIEFVARPEEVHRLRSAIPATVRRGVEQDQGFAGCLMMISDREARLVSVITFWTGEDRMTNCSKKARWLYRLLTPYLDHCLRVRTLDAYLTVLGPGHAPNANTCSKELSLCVV